LQANASQHQLAILFLSPALRRDELRRQRHDPLMAGCHQARTKKRMEVFRAAVRTAPRAAVLAVDLARAEVLGAVERNQQSPIQALK